MALSAGTVGESSDLSVAERFLPGSLDEIESFADLATDRMLLVSESRGADVGPRFLFIAIPLDPDGDGVVDCGLRDDSPDLLPFA